MKHNRKYNLFGGLLVSTLLLTTACAGISDLDAAKIETDAKQKVTISVMPESQTGGMRAATISKGTKVNKLIYELYEVSGETYTKLANYSQTVDVTTYPYNDIEIEIERGKTYKMAFWAQSSECSAYTTTNLREVKVDYNDAANNDESRDAFCYSLDIDGRQDQNHPYIATLKRPFAQINVGTTGADYRNIMENPNIFPNKKVTQSKITLTGVANQINVLTGEVSKTSDTSDEITVNFDFAKIPAFMNMDKLPDDLVGGTDYTDDEEKIAAGYKDTSKTDEEFLLVNLDGEQGYKDYKTKYPTLGENKEYLTETFKYLSMCYVLVPSSTNIPDEMQDHGYSSVLSEVKVSFAETGGTDGQTAVNGNTKAPIQLNYVPVKQNYRTNILGGLKYMNDPTDPDPNNPIDPDPDDPDPDDPTSVFGLVSFLVELEPMYDGEYNGSYDSTQTWVHYKTNPSDTQE